MQPPARKDLQNTHFVYENSNHWLRSANKVDCIRDDIRATIAGHIRLSLSGYEALNPAKDDELTPAVDDGVENGFFG